MQPRIRFTFIATRAHCWIILACCSLGLPGSFWQKYTPASQTPPCNGARDYSVPGEGLPTDLTQFLSTQSSKLLRSLWLVAPPSRISLSLSPSSLLLSASLVRKFSPVIQISVIKIVSDPITNSKEQLLLTGYQAAFESSTTTLWTQQFSQFSTHLVILPIQSVSYQLVRKDIVGDCVKCLAKNQGRWHPQLVPCLPGKLFHCRRQSGWSSTIVYFCWLFQTTSFSFMCMARASWKTCSVIFPGTEMSLTALQFLILLLSLFCRWVRLFSSSHQDFLWSPWPFRDDRKVALTWCQPTLLASSDVSHFPTQLNFLKNSTSKGRSVWFSLLQQNPTVMWHGSSTKGSWN